MNRKPFEIRGESALLGVQVPSGRHRACFSLGNAPCPSAPVRQGVLQAVKLFHLLIPRWPVGW